MYFNEFDTFAAQWLGNLFPAATVDQRSISDVTAADLVRFDASLIPSGRDRSDCSSCGPAVCGMLDTEPIPAKASSNSSPCAVRQVADVPACARPQELAIHHTPRTVAVPSGAIGKSVSGCHPGQSFREFAYDKSAPLLGAEDERCEQIQRCAPVGIHRSKYSLHFGPPTSETLCRIGDTYLHRPRFGREPSNMPSCNFHCSIFSRDVVMTSRLGNGGI